MFKPRLTNDSLDRLPHRPPFRFLSEMTKLEPGVFGTAQWVISGDEDFFAGHFPGEPIVPGVLLAESLAQLAGLVGFSEADTPQRRVRLAHVDIKFATALAPPAVAFLTARLIRVMGPLMMFETTAQSNGKTVASGTLTLVTGPDNSEGEVS